MAHGVDIFYRTEENAFITFVDCILRLATAQIGRLVWGRGNCGGRMEIKTTTIEILIAIPDA